MPRRNKGDSRTTVDGEVVAIGVNGRPVGAPPTKKEKAVQQKKLFEAAFLGDVQEVVSILELWQDLQVTTQQRYLETKVGTWKILQMSHFFLLSGFVSLDMMGVLLLAAFLFPSSRNHSLKQSIIILPAHLGS